MPEISAIIPCYNSYILMNKCLESLEKQTFKDFEVIIIDDFSSDNSYVSLLKYCEKSKLNIKLLKNLKNIGAGPTRNIGINAATGKYITFIDSDDYLNINCMKNIFNIINIYQCDCVIFDYYILNKRKVKHKTSLYKNESGLIDKRIALVNTKGGSACKVYLKKNIIDNNIQFADLQRNEDMPFTKSAISVCQKIYYYKYPLYYYVMHANSLMHNYSLLNENNAIIAFGIIESFLNENYKVELEAIFVKEYLYSTTMTLIKRKASINNIKKHIILTTNKYPNWEKNKLIKNYPCYVKIYVWLIRNKFVKILCFIEHIKKLLS